jgi:hypothetical protein
VFGEGGLRMFKQYIAVQSQSMSLYTSAATRHGSQSPQSATPGYAQPTCADCCPLLLRSPGQQYVWALEVQVHNPPGVQEDQAFGNVDRNLSSPTIPRHLAHPNVACKIAAFTVLCR